MSWRAPAVVVVLAVAAAACGSTGSDELSAVGSDGPADVAAPADAEPTPIPLGTNGDEPAEEPPSVDEPDAATPEPPPDCGTIVASADLLASPPASIDETRNQLPVMHELYEDTVLVWEQFGIQPDHMMLNGLPRMLLQTDDVAGRCEEILGAVARPDLVRFVEWTEEDYSDMLDRGVLPPWRQLIEADIGFKGEDDGPWAGIGTAQYGVASVTLRADQEQLAATLLERYGQLIQLSVGNFAYPLDRGDPATAVSCQTLPEGTAPPGIAIEAMSLIGDSNTGQVEVVVSNNGTKTVHLVPERVAELTAPGSNELVSAYTRPQTAEGRESLTLDPGTDITLTAIPSTAACNADAGYSLPAGTYDFVLPIYVFDAPAWEGDVSDTVLLPRLQIELG